MCEKRNTLYCQRVWLNDNNSPSTGNATAYDGLIEDDGVPYHSTFLSISDCHVTARLHKAQYDTNADFLKKMIRLRDFISEFINHLKDSNKKEK